MWRPAWFTAADPPVSRAFCRNPCAAWLRAPPGVGALVRGGGVDSATRRPRSCGRSSLGAWLAGKPLLRPSRRPATLRTRSQAASSPGRCQRRTATSKRFLFAKSPAARSAEAWARWGMPISRSLRSPGMAEHQGRQWPAAAAILRGSHSTGRRYELRHPAGSSGTSIPRGARGYLEDRAAPTFWCSSLQAYAVVVEPGSGCLHA